MEPPVQQWNELLLRPFEMTLPVQMFTLDTFSSGA